MNMKRPVSNNKELVNLLSVYKSLNGTLPSYLAQKLHYCSHTRSLKSLNNELLIGNCRNVRGLGKSKVVFRLFEKLRYSNGSSTKFESLYQEYKYLEEENGKMVVL